MTSVISNSTGNAILQRYLIDNPAWLALHESDPGVTGSGATELTGGDYGRELTEWSSPSAKTSVLATAIVYDNLPASTITWFAVWDQEIGGTMLFSVEVGGSGILVEESARLVIPASDIAISV